MSYLLPTSVETALDALAGRRSTILAGATDYYPSLAGRHTRDHDIVDITGIDDLRGIDHHDGTWRIGSLTTWAEIARADLPRAFDGLRAAAGRVGGVQIQNVASIGGNLCNASPAADGVPPLLTLDASVELMSSSGTRVLGLDEFLLGNRLTALQPDELLVALLIPDPPDGSIGSFEKLGARAYQVISIVMVAALADIDDAMVRSARVAVGACSAVAQRLTGLEHDLVGASLDESLAITDDHLAALSPIDDVRATASYRLAVTPTLIARALQSCRGKQP